MKIVFESDRCPVRVIFSAARQGFLIQSKTSGIVWTTQGTAKTEDVAIAFGYALETTICNTEASELPKVIHGHR